MNDLSLTILAYLPPYNRQAQDLHRSALANGISSKLVHTRIDSERTSHIRGTKFTVPHGRFSKFHVLANVWRLLWGGLCLGRSSHIVVFNPNVIWAAAVLKILWRAKIVYYALEYVSLSGFLKWQIRHFVDGIIDVEENRNRQLMNDLGMTIPSTIVYNMPRLVSHGTGGKLRSYLQREYNVSPAEKITVYAGSHQAYSCFDQIIEAAHRLPTGYRVVFMTYKMPEEFLSKFNERVLVVPPVSFPDLYEWLVDADALLLPYEDEADFNVKNCSPQKLFDALAVGVPIVASDRPLIRRIVREVAAPCGSFADFRDSAEIARGIMTCAAIDQALARSAMQGLYRLKYNYDRGFADVLRFLKVS